MGEAGQHWTIIIGRQPQKVMRRLPGDLLERLDQKIRALADDPRPPGCKKLAGYDNLYRVRVGDWRISYAVEDDRLIVLILEVAPRGGAYRDL
jgi:mRNA interferase RelE/StbE